MYKINRLKRRNEMPSRDLSITPPRPFFLSLKNREREKVKKVRKQITEKMSITK